MQAQTHMCAVVPRYTWADACHTNKQAKATHITRGRRVCVNTILQSDVWTGRHWETGKKTFSAAHASRLTGMKMYRQETSCWKY